MRRHRNHIIAIVPWPRHPMRKDEEFSEWYNGVIDRAELSDKRYPIKGMNVWRPYGWAIMKLIDQAIRGEFDSTGHGEVNSSRIAWSINFMIAQPYGRQTFIPLIG